MITLALAAKIGKPPARGGFALIEDVQVTVYGAGLVGLPHEIAQAERIMESAYREVALDYIRSKEAGGKYTHALFASAVREASRRINARVGQLEGTYAADWRIAAESGEGTLKRMHEIAAANL